MGGLPVAARQHDSPGGWGDPDQAAEGVNNSFGPCSGHAELLQEKFDNSLTLLIWSGSSVGHLMQMHVAADRLLMLCMQDGHAVRFLPKSAYLASPKRAHAYVCTAARLLSRAHCLHNAARQNGARSQGGGQEEGASTSGALQALWPLAEGTLAAQLLQQLPKEDLPLLCLLYWRLLAALPDLAPACGLTTQKEEARYVNALVRAAAFHIPMTSPSQH